jgi:hypothetical protein
MAQDLSMIGIDRAKSVLSLGRGLDDPARWCARRTACVPCLGVSGSVEPQHTALARLERPPEVAARILMSSVLHPSPRASSGPSQSARRLALGGMVRWWAAWDIPQSTRRPYANTTPYGTRIV